jgi:hypothetical protein
MAEVYADLFRAVFDSPERRSKSVCSSSLHLTWGKRGGERNLDAVAQGQNRNVAQTF